MNKNFHNYKTTVGNYCLTVCILNYLISEGYEFDEEDLVCCDDMLSIEPYSNYGGLSSSIKAMVMNTCKVTNIVINELSKNSFIEQLTLGKNLIFNVNCKYLNYSKTFEMTPTSQSFHYINVLDKKSDDLFYISDGYIPTSTPSKYSDWFYLNKNIFDDCSIYLLELKDVKNHTNKERISCIENSIIKYLEKYNSILNVFDKFIISIENIKNIYNDQLTKRYFLEMAANIAIGGTYASRIFFLKNVIKCNINKNTKSKIHERMVVLLQLYFQLRLLLVKCSFSNNNNDIKNTIDKIHKIKNLEFDIFSNL